MIQYRQFPWIYAPNLRTAGDFLPLSLEEARHVTKVRRCSSENIIVAFDGNGNLRSGRLQVEKKQVLLCFTEPLQPIQPTSASYQLVLCLPNHVAILEEILCKVCELGMHKLLPVFSQHTERIHWTPNQWQQRTERWQRILIEACKQAKNPFLPTLLSPIEFSQLSKDILGTCIHGSLTAKTSLFDILSTNKTSKSKNSSTQSHQRIYSCLIGCEGGFSQEEESFLEKFSQGICLPTYVLRTETAMVCLGNILKIII